MIDGRPPQLTVIVDADSCPKEVRELLVRAATQRRFRLQFWANRPLTIVGNARTRVIRDTTVDEAILAYLASLPTSPDHHHLIITRDIPLAEAVLSHGGQAMNDRGTLFDATTIAERRSMRDAAAQIRQLGLERMTRRRTYGAKERKAFADTLDRYLTTLRY